MRYKESATRALVPLTLDVTQGGTSTLRGGDAFFEEVSANPTHVLNGHLFAAFAAWEACKFGFAPAGLREVHEAAVETLAAWLPRYDAGGWSYYELASPRGGERPYATIGYHQAHLAQLHVYYGMTKRDEFFAMSRHWARALDDWTIRARVWADGAAWLSQTAAQRLRARGF